MPKDDRRPTGHPRSGRELGALARRPAVGPFPHRLAQGRADDGDLVPGHRRGIHQGQRGRLRRAACASCISSAASSIDVKGKRAIAQTKMTISQRARSRASSATWSAPAASTTSWRSAKAAGASCCASRSTRRTASTRSIPSAKLVLDQKLLAQFPEGYRHLAYLQTRDRLQGEDRHARPRRAGAGRALRQGRGLAEGPQAVTSLRGYRPRGWRQRAEVRIWRETVGDQTIRGPSCHWPTNSTCSTNSTSCA